MSSLDVRRVLFYVLVLTVPVMILEAENIHDVVIRVSNYAIKQKAALKTPSQVHVDRVRKPHGKKEKEKNAKSKREEKTNYIETNMKGLGGAINRYLSLSHEDNFGKRALDNRSIPWGCDVPIIFDSSYPDPFDRNVVMRVCRFISERTCLNIKDETNRWDPSNVNWFTDNGYSWNSYIKILVQTTSCTTKGNGPVNGSFVETQPCFDSDINLHELLHSLAVPHGQQAFIAPRYLSTFMQSIKEELQDTYITSPNYQAQYFDPLSTMLYDTGTWSSMGDDTTDLIRPDQNRPDDVTSSEHIVFEELNKRYNCSDKFCKSTPLDCAPGYPTYIKKACKCVCPQEYNSTTNCKTLINQADKSLKWDIPISVFAGGKNFNCPAGFHPTGWFSFCGTWASTQNVSPAPFPQLGTTIYIPVCSKTTPTTNIDWNSLPLGGRYCFIKPKGVECGGVLTPATAKFVSGCPPQSNGSLGDITINDNTITINFCCSDNDHTKMVTNLPNETPFQLFTIFDCPNVQGMRSYTYSLGLFTKVSSTSGKPSKPRAYVYPSQYVIVMCYYQPAVYGDSQTVTLTSSKRKVTITTPGYPGARPADTRLFYCFNAPEDTQLLVTFIDYNLDGDDKMRIKRFNKWGEPYRIDNDNPWTQFVTERNYLCMEYWTDYLTNVSNTGAKFTVELLYDSDSCFNTSQNGMDYLGTTNITETYEACLPWKYTVNCSDTPVDAQDALTGYYESNYCRNPGGKLIQPWCYVYRNDTSCMKRYCDVCNTKQPVDTAKTSDCKRYMNEDPTFCQKAIQRFLCFKSCGMTQAPADSSGASMDIAGLVTFSTSTKGTCGSPPVPADGVLVERPKPSYKIGERVYVKCKNAAISDDSTSLMLCTRNGWNGPQSACLDCPKGWTPYGNRCIYFTTEEKTRPDALAFCRSFNPNGTLMHIRNQTDQYIISEVRNKTKSYYEQTWFGAYICKEESLTWCFLDTNIPMTYLNWASDIKTAKNTVAYIYQEISSSNIGGQWYPTSIDDTTATKTFACQVDRPYPPDIKDNYKSCQSVLSENPFFCEDKNTMNDAVMYCGESCGLNSESGQCKIPASSRYKRTYGTGSVDTGDVMTFVCNPGYFLTGGDTSRACGLGGTLLGTAPVCDRTPSIMDVGLQLVRPRMTTLDSQLAFMMDVDGYRVPFNGKITTWYYHCQRPGLIYFYAARKSGSSYKIINYNAHTCTPGWKWSFKVPASNQTSVQAGDIVGAWTSDSDTLSVNNCDGAKFELINMHTESVTDLDSLLAATSFSDIKCILPAFGYRVED